MGKFSTGFMQEVNKQKEFEKEQEKLKIQHNINEKNVIVVEKNNMVKFTINTIFRIFRYIATVILLCLACIGLAAMIYSAPREEMLVIFYTVIEQIKTALGL
ncbi:hypothetical protein [Clostridium minihomine]|uniref:hypothetical protein n=1 Tax=Clostridium minihomine TaxID=2045012 RepID=UPI000C777F3B|nr:hypothetical protein [Clostridium minihomine]